MHMPAGTALNDTVSKLIRRHDVVCLLAIVSMSFVNFCQFFIEVFQLVIFYLSPFTCLPNVCCVYAVTGGMVFNDKF